MPSLLSEWNGTYLVQPCGLSMSSAVPASHESGSEVLAGTSSRGGLPGGMAAATACTMQRERLADAASRTQENFAELLRIAARNIWNPGAFPYLMHRAFFVLASCKFVVHRTYVQVKAYSTSFSCVPGQRRGHTLWVFYVNALRCQRGTRQAARQRIGRCSPLR